MPNITNKKLSKKLLGELTKALESAGKYGSVEIFIQNSRVTQISVRNIKKTNLNSKINSTL